MKFKLDKDVEFILEKLEEHGFEAYIVGGCVRDLILGLTPKDFDICTNALPNETIKVFKNYNIIETGLKHGTITLRLNKKSYEITTFRKDGEYSDNRRPDEVIFVSDLKEDLARRDFTVNAIAYNPSKGIFDFFNGLDDIKNKLIRSVGNGKKRFEEDALRILRGLRFSSTYNFQIEEETSKDIKSCAHLLKNISAERINIELCKLIIGDNVENIFSNYIDVIQIIIPELKAMIGFKQHNIHHKYDVYEHTIKSLLSIEKNVILRLTMLLHDIGKPTSFSMDENGVGHFYGHDKISKEMARKILNRLKFDNKSKKMILTLIEYHDIRMAPQKKVVRKWLNKLGENVFLELLKVQKSDSLGQSDIFLDDKLKNNQKLIEIYNEIKEQSLCFSLKDLAINGNDLISLGITDGKKIGEILNTILNLVIENDVQNTKEILIKEIKKLIAD